MAELHFAFGASGQLHPADAGAVVCFLLALDLLLQAVVAEDVLTGQPLGVFSEHASTDRTLEFPVHELVLLR